MTTQAQLCRIERHLPREQVPCQVRHYEQHGIPVVQRDGRPVTAEGLELEYTLRTPDIVFEPLATCTHKCRERYQ
jgi:hypothetical protein